MITSQNEVSAGPKTTGAVNSPPETRPRVTLDPAVDLTENAPLLESLRVRPLPSESVAMIEQLLQVPVSILPLTVVTVAAETSAAQPNKNTNAMICFVRFRTALLVP